MPTYKIKKIECYISRKNLISKYNLVNWDTTIKINMRLQKAVNYFSFEKKKMKK